MGSLLRRLRNSTQNKQASSVNIQTSTDPYWFGVSDGEQGSTSHRIPAILPGVAAAGAAAVLPSALIRGITGRGGISLARSALKNVANGDLWHTGIQSGLRNRVLNELKIPESDLTEIPKSMLPGVLGAGAGAFAGGPLGFIAASPRLVRDVANAGMNNPQAAKRMARDAVIGGAGGLVLGSGLALGSNLSEYEAGRGATPEGPHSLLERLRKTTGIG